MSKRRWLAVIGVLVLGLLAAVAVQTLLVLAFGSGWAEHVGTAAGALLMSLTTYAIYWVMGSERYADEPYPGARHRQRKHFPGSPTEHE